MKKFIILLTFLITYFDWSLQNTNGVKVRISKSGLIFAGNLGVDILASYINAISFPKISQKKSLYSFEATNMRVSNFVKPSVVVVPVAGVGLSASLNNAAILINFSWKYKIGVGIISITRSGSGSVTSKSISISTTLNIGRDSNGKPTVSATSCSCSISGFDVDIKGGKLERAMYNFIVDQYEKDIKNTIKKEVCEQITKIINENGKSQLATLNTEVKIDSQILLDYKLTNNPIFTSEYIETTHAGEFYTTTGIRYANLLPPSNLAINNGKMANIALTEHLFNSGGYVLQKLGRLNQIIPINHESISTLLNQTDDSEFQLKIEVTDPPFIVMNESALMINATTNVQLQQLDGEDIISAQLSLLLSCDIYFSDGRIKGKVLSIIPSTIISNNTLLELSSEELTELLAILMEEVLPSINLKGAEGFPIPTLSNLKLVSPVLQRAVGYTIVGTDLQRA